mgnify:CR=1 FL=1
MNKPFDIQTTCSGITRACAKTDLASSGRVYLSNERLEAEQLASNRPPLPGSRAERRLSVKHLKPRRVKGFRS